MRKIEQALTAALKAAEDAFRLANERLRDIAEGTPSGIPIPDSNLSLSNAGSQCTRAFEAVKTALQRLNDFTAKGIVPDDLKDWDGVSPLPLRRRS